MSKAQGQRFLSRAAQLAGEVINITSGSSSVAKGESLVDTARTLEATESQLLSCIAAAGVALNR